jgi:hypothetical protein
VDEAKKRDAEATRRAERINSFFLKPGGQADVIFLDPPSKDTEDPDGDIFAVGLHLINRGKYWDNFVCLGDVDDCPLCQSGDSPNWAYIFTVLNLDGITRSDGTVIKPIKQAMEVRAKAAREEIHHQRELHKGMFLGKFTVRRGSKKNDPRTGDRFDFLGRMGKDDLRKILPEGEKAKEYFAPFDYEKLYAPLSVAELEQVAGVNPSAVPGSSPEPPEEEAPFATEDDKSIEDMVGEEDALDL